MGRGLSPPGPGKTVSRAALSPASEEAGGLRHSPGASPHVAAPAGRVNLRRRLWKEGRGLRSSVPRHPPPRYAPAPRGSPRPSRARLIPASTATRSLCPPKSGSASSQLGQLQPSWVVGLVATREGGLRGTNVGSSRGVACALCSPGVAVLGPALHRESRAGPEGQNSRGGGVTHPDVPPTCQGPCCPTRARL